MRCVIFFNFGTASMFLIDYSLLDTVIFKFLFIGTVKSKSLPLYLGTKKRTFPLCLMWLIIFSPKFSGVPYEVE